MEQLHLCGHCGFPIPKRRQHISEYCDNKCCQAAYRERRSGGVLTYKRIHRGMIRPKR